MEMNSKYSNKALAIEVSFQYRGETLEKALEDINTRYNVNFSYINESIPLGKKIYSSAQKKTLGLALDQLFLNTYIKYFTIGEQIILVSRGLADTLNLESPQKVAKSRDSVRVYPVGKRVNGKKVFYWKKISTLFKNVSLGLSNSNELQADSLRKDSIRVLDSLNRLQLRTKPSNFKEESWKVKKAKVEKGPFLERVSLNFIIAPELSYWKLSDGVFGGSLENYNAYAKRNFGFSLGSMVSFYFRNRIMLESGILFTVIQKEGRHTDYFVNTWEPNKMISEKYRFSNNYNYLQIPILVGVNFFKSKKISLSASGGLVTNLLIDAGGESIYRTYETKYFTFINTPPYNSSGGKPIVPKEISYNKTIFSSMVMLNINYNVTKRSQIVISPTFKYYLNSIYNGDAPIEERFYTFGLYGGLKYFIKK